MARLHLIRHARTAETGKRLTGRAPGVALTDEGRAEAEALASDLAGIPLAAVYTSPVLRCRETARAVAAPHGLEPIPYRSLIEVDYGTYAGRAYGSLRRTRAWRMLFVAPSRVRFPGGETLMEVAVRSVAACEEIAAAHGGDEVALVSHGDMIRTAVAHYLGVHPDLFQRIVVDPASHSIVDLSGDAPRVIAVNRVARR